MICPRMSIDSNRIDIGICINQIIILLQNALQFLIFLAPIFRIGQRLDTEHLRPEPLEIKTFQYR